MTLFLLGAGMLLVAAVASVLGRRRRDELPYFVLVLAGCVLAAIPAVSVLWRGETLTRAIAGGLPGGDWVFGIDALSAVFLLMILVVGAASALYGIAYLGSEREHRAVWASHAVFAGVLAGLAFVVTARAVMPFLVAWELMAVGSYLLIVLEHEQAEVRRAGLIYLVTTHAATLGLFAMFAVWGQGTADWSFEALARSGSSLAAGGNAVFALALFGFGVKAGLVPLHFWLPPAHAAAPSHVSALLSGVVIKMGIYGMLRVVTLLGLPPRWWGWTVLLLGVVSGIFGVLWALAQHDIKRLLAYHSVENIGIILLGIGVGALGGAYGYPALAVLGYAAAVLHTVNHALFKSLLFMGAGAVLRVTGTRNMEELGGLARRMPLTWITFAVASAAIVGLPPLNGFVSEWLVYQGLFRAGQTAGGLRLAILAAPALALIGGLALACFTKVAGVVFLGRARSARPEHARELGAASLVPCLVLAGLCIAIGIVPGILMPVLFAAGGSIAHEPAASSGSALATVMRDSQWLTAVALGIVVLIVLVWLLRTLAMRGKPVRRLETWSCGYGHPTARMQYTASSFAAPLLGVFGPLSGIREHRGATVYHSTPDDLVLDRVVLPWWERLHRAALRLRPIQQGRLHMYLLYVVATMLALLVYLVLAPTP